MACCKSCSLMTFFAILVVGVLAYKAFLKRPPVAIKREITSIMTVDNKVDNEKLITILNSALADEWLTHYQYWVGALVIKEPKNPKTPEELNQHSKEEFEHAKLLADRILELGGTPILEPKEWYKASGCGYTIPVVNDEVAIIKQNIEGEVCAIKVYTHLLKLTEKVDQKTAEMIAKILKDEETHKKDLEELL